MTQAFMDVTIDTVLTAHPTEAKRKTVLELHRQLYLQLVKRENTMWTPMEQAGIRNEIMSILERLWRTGEILFDKPDVSAERRNAMNYLYNIFPEVIHLLDMHLLQTWQEAGLNPEAFRSPEQFPKFRFSNWVGGDRNGNPFVTADVTRETLLDMRRHALLLVRNHLGRLASKLSLSERLQKPCKTMRERIGELSSLLGQRGVDALNRNRHEPWRQFLNLMIAALPSEEATLPEKRIRLPVPEFGPNCSSISLCSTGCSKKPERTISRQRISPRSTASCRRSVFISARSISGRTAGFTTWLSPNS